MGYTYSISLVCGDDCTTQRSRLRCLRLGKTCSVSAPIRKKDRIAELEAQLEEMTRLLRKQELQDERVGAEGRTSPRTPISLDARTRTPDSRAVGVGAVNGRKKRRLSGDDGRNALENGNASARDELEIDHVVSKEVQRALVVKYRNEMEPVFPFAVRHGY